MGAPNHRNDVEPFLFNLFSDPAILSMPKLLRFPLAKVISRYRSLKTKEIYDQIGGHSPLLKNTLAQAEALEHSLYKREVAGIVKVFVCMRYWNPLVKEVLPEIISFTPDTLVLLPLYPQFSTVTTGSFFLEWQEIAHPSLPRITTRHICCYPTEPGFIDALAENTLRTISQVRQIQRRKHLRLLLSAHSIPVRKIKTGDPYKWQCEQTALSLIERLNFSRIDWSLCYQSEIGLFEWIGPRLSDELNKAGQCKKQLIIVPITFVSEHSETLVTLDIEYRDFAKKAGITSYARVETVGIQKAFIDGLAKLVISAISTEKPFTSWSGQGPCSSCSYKSCPRTI
jgi:ferrochelatase